MAKAIPALLIIALPFFVWGGSILQGQTNGLVFVLFIAAIIFIQNNWLRIITLAVTGWLAVAYSLSFIGSFPVFPFVDSSLLILFGITVYLIVYYTDIPFNFYANIICISALIQCSIGICQLWFDPIETILANIIIVKKVPRHNEVVGILGNSNYLAAYLAISLPFFFRGFSLRFYEFFIKKVKIKIPYSAPGWWLAVPVICFGLYIADTATATAAAIIGVSYFIFGYIGIIAGVALAAIGFFVFSGHDIVNDARVIRWVDAVQKVFHSPSSFLFGYGQGTAWKLGDQLHSEYIATFFNYGAIGLAALIGYVVTISRNNKILFTAFIILCVNMIGNHPLHVATTAILAITIISLIERDKRRAIT